MLTREQKNIIKGYSIQTSYNYETWLKFAELLKQYDIYFDVYFDERFLREYYKFSLEQGRDLLTLGEEYNKEMKNTLSGIRIQIRDNLHELAQAIIKDFHIPKKLIKRIFG